MTYASEDLMKEHEGILFGLSILEKMVNMLEAQDCVDQDDLARIVDFFTLFADKCHHGKEEGIYFPEMEASGIRKENGPIGQMLLEHVEGRGFIALMRESLSGKIRTDLFIESGGKYIKLLRNHIEKENTILFPLADRTIPWERQASLLERFEEHETRVMGEGTHDKLHAVLHEFEEKYLVK